MKEAEVCVILPFTSVFEEIEEKVGRNLETLSYLYQHIYDLDKEVIKQIIYDVLEDQRKVYRLIAKMDFVRW